VLAYTRKVTMRKSHYQYVLVGGGAAASSAAAAIRAIDPAGPVLLVGQEINRPYHRPLLARDYLLGRKRHEDLFTHDPAWFAANHVDLSGHCAPALHVDAALATPNLRHLEYFHDHVRIESLFFDGVAFAGGGGELRPDRTAPGHGLTFKAADAERYRIG